MYQAACGNEPMSSCDRRERSLRRNLQYPGGSLHQRLRIFFEKVDKKIIYLIIFTSYRSDRRAFVAQQAVTFKIRRRHFCNDLAAFLHALFSAIEWGHEKKGVPRNARIGVS